MIINKLFITTILVTRYWQCCIGTTTIILHFCCWTVWNRISWCWWRYQDFVSTNSFESGFNMAKQGKELFLSNWLTLDQIVSSESHWENNIIMLSLYQNWAYLTKRKVFSPFSNLSGWLGKSHSVHLLFLIMPFLRKFPGAQIKVLNYTVWK